MLSGYGRFIDELLSEENIGHDTITLKKQLQTNFKGAMEKISNHIQTTWKMDLMGNTPLWFQAPVHPGLLLDYESQW